MPKSEKETEKQEKTAKEKEDQERMENAKKREEEEARQREADLESRKERDYQEALAKWQNTEDNARQAREATRKPNQPRVISTTGKPRVFKKEELMVPVNMNHRCAADRKTAEESCDVRKNARR